jgi:hypothetical protein
MNADFSTVFFEVAKKTIGGFKPEGTTWTYEPGRFEIERHLACATASWLPRSCSAQVEMIAPGCLESFFGQFGSFKSVFVSVTRGMNPPMVFFATSKNTVEKSRPS